MATPLRFQSISGVAAPDLSTAGSLFKGAFASLGKAAETVQEGREAIRVEDKANLTANFAAQLRSAQTPEQVASINQAIGQAGTGVDVDALSILGSARPGEIQEAQTATNLFQAQQANQANVLGIIESERINQALGSLAQSGAFTDAEGNFDSNAFASTAVAQRARPEDVESFLTSFKGATGVAAQEKSLREGIKREAEFKDFERRQRLTASLKSEAENIKSNTRAGIEDWIAKTFTDTDFFTDDAAQNAISAVNKQWGKFTPQQIKTALGAAMEGGGDGTDFDEGTFKELLANTATTERIAKEQRILQPTPVTPRLQQQTIQDRITQLGTLND